MFPTLKRTESELAWSNSAKGVSESLFDKARLLYQDATRIRNECKELEESLQEHVDAVDEAKCHFVDKDEINAINKNIARLLAGISVHVDEYAGQDEAQIAAAKELDKYVKQLEAELNEHEKNGTRPNIPLLESIYNASLSEPDGPVNDRALEKILSCAIPVQRVNRKRLAALMTRAKEIAATADVAAAQAKHVAEKVSAPSELRVETPVAQTEEEDTEVEGDVLPAEKAAASPKSATVGKRRRRGRRGGRRSRGMRDETKSRPVSKKSQVAPQTEDEDLPMPREETNIEVPKEVVSKDVKSSEQTEPEFSPMSSDDAYTKPAVHAKARKLAAMEIPAEDEYEERGMRLPRSHGFREFGREMEDESHVSDESHEENQVVTHDQDDVSSSTSEDTQEEDDGDYRETQEGVYAYRPRRVYADPSSFYDDFGASFHPGMMRFSRPRTAAPTVRRGNNTTNTNRRLRQTPRRAFDDDFGPFGPFDYFGADPLSMGFRPTMQYMMHPFFPYSR